MARRRPTPANSRDKRNRMKSSLRQRRLLHQSLEKREMLAGDLDLISVNPNADAIFSRSSPNLLDSGPTELTFRFGGGSDLQPASLDQGIRISYAGDDQQLGTADDQIVQPGWLGLGETDTVVVARFAQPLEDGRYRIEVFGTDNPVAGMEAVRNVDGDIFQPQIAGTDRDTLDFELELGARVQGVVPQPVIRDANGDLQHQTDTIHVYFDDNDLFAGGGTSTLSDRQFYQLIRTEDTVSSGDDTVFLPDSVNVVEFEQQLAPNPSGPGTVPVQVRVNRVELTFSGDINALAGSGAFRLKVGSSDPLGQASSPLQPAIIPIVGDPADSVATSQLIATLTNSTAVTLSSTIADIGLPFDYPGGESEPGHRDIEEQSHYLGGEGDGTAGIQTRYFNFALNRSYGTNASGQPLQTLINPEQMQRIREIYDIYGQLLGVQFVETVDQGTTVVVGDMFPNGEVSGPGAPFGVAGAGLAIMDSAETWDNSYGGDFFHTAIHELGHSNGLGHTYEQPGGTVQGNETLYSGSSTEWAFPGDVDIVHGLNLYRPDNRDVDMYRLDLPAGSSGELILETFAERRLGGSLLNSELVLYKQVGSGPLVQVAANDDAYGDDAALSVQLPAEDENTAYFVGVTARGNGDFDPQRDGTGSGGSSEGAYDLLVRFKSNTGATITDAAGTPIDGDGDGTPGGAFDFWFQTADAANTLFVDASAPVGVNDGSTASPFREIDLALSAASEGDIVRIVGNAGADGIVGLADDNFAGAADNLSYVIGKGLNNSTLKDGKNLIVPKGVTVMVDAGVILKMADSRIAVGSGSNGVDLSGGAFQVLGVPHLPVFMTSYNDSTKGLENNPLNVSPGQGDWGGIDIRNGVDRGEGRTDLEREGIFVNYIAGADLRYGGGLVEVNGTNQAIAPIRMDSARPTILNNLFHQNSGAALSADPSSFEETNFTSSRYQSDEAFVPDYDRVGPQIYANTILDNSINGLLIRIDTAAGGEREQLNVAGRFDDTEVTHILGDNLIITGNPSGSVQHTQPAPPTTVAFGNVAAPSGSAGLAAGTYQYKISYIDAYGVESLPTDATDDFVLNTAGEAIRLTGLPTAGNEVVPAGGQTPAAEAPYVSRRLYRSVDGSGVFELVAELNRSSTTYVDGRATPDNVTPFNPVGESYRARPDARLVVDPGIVIKGSDVRIETGFGADLIAEGTEGRPVIFTSRSDDRYGAGGTFDTDLNGFTEGAAGDWAGIYSRPFSRISLDHAVVAYAGGTSSVNGTSVSFSAIELQQSFARIANTTFEANSGLAQGGSRVGLGPHDSSVIFAVGAQPAILNNRFIDMSAGTAAISINVNSLNSTALDDFGRQTGEVDLIDHPPGNVGPLVFGNQIDAGGLAGMRVRAEMLTTESVWDDTDIVHIVQGDITAPDLHTYGGLRLQSHPEESLVVKFGAGAELIAGGRPLDIEDRVGGIVQVIGSPGFPVILTSLGDDSVGAGLDTQGQPTLDTNGNGSSVGSPGDWGGILFTEFTHDRNVEVITEKEGAIGAAGDLNGTSANSQTLGLLATGEKSADENLRLGYTIHGTIASPGDVDVYSFLGTAGTPVWIDVDRTVNRLDSVIELIDGSGTVIATSDNSHDEQLLGALPFVQAGENALPMQKSPSAVLNGNGTYRDFYTTNPDDAGMRLILPGVEGSQQQYFVRITGAAQSSGIYQMQLRLQETDEFAGSTVRYADIRYADIGIKTEGLPSHSFLTGEGSVTNGAIDLGNIGNSDRAAISVAGDLTEGRTFNQFSFKVERDSIQKQADPVNPDNIDAGEEIFTSLSIDVDFADGAGRPDTSILLYYRGIDPNAPAQLVMIGTDSNIAGDRGGPGEGADLDDQTRGSVGQRDPFLGTVELRGGFYELLVVSNTLIPTEMDQYFEPSTSYPNFRLEPISSVVRIAEDRFSDATVRQSTASGPISVAFDVVKEAGTGQTNTTPYALGDVPLFIVGNSNNNTSRLYANNAQIGVTEAIIGNDFSRVGPIALHPAGYVYGYTGEISTGETDANTSTFYRLDDAGNGSLQTFGSSGISTFETYLNTATPPVRVVGTPVGTGTTRNGDGMLFSGLAYRVTGGNNDTLRLYGVASRGNGTVTFPQPTGYNAASSDAPLGEQDAPARNYIYRLDPTTGAAISASSSGDRTGNRRASGAGTDAVELGRVAPDLPGMPSPIVGSATFKADYEAYLDVFGDIVGLTAVGNDLYAVTDTGALTIIRSSQLGDTSGNRNGDRPIGEFVGFVSDDIGNPIEFTALTTGPRNVADGYDGNGERSSFPYAETLFGTDSSGNLFTFDTSGVLENKVGFGETNVATGVSSIKGIAFSNLDVNLWHQTNNQQASAAGHGTLATEDGARRAADGQYSLYFGYDSDINESSEWDGQYNPTARTANAYNFAGGAHGSVQSHSIDLSDYSGQDEPTLYFNYLLETEDKEAIPFEADHALDALRVYVSSVDNPDWVLVATNNGEKDDDYSEFNDSLDEFDFRYNGFVDETVEFTQELFDANQWRQARISLAPWAGDSDVRIRYEFDSAGEVSPYSMEMRANSPDRMLDENNLSFVLSPSTAVLKYFEFDFGLVLDTPSGSAIANGATIELTPRDNVTLLPTGPAITYTFHDLDSGTPAPVNAISYRISDSAGAVADAIRLAIQADFGISNSAQSDARLGVESVNPGEHVSIVTSALPAAMVVEEFGVNNFLATSIPVSVGMNSVEIRDALRQGLAAGLNPADPTALDTYQVFGDTVRTFGLSVSDAGPLTVFGGEYANVNLPGAHSGVYQGIDSQGFGSSQTDSLRVAGRRGENNNFNGIFIDDVIIGFAERGEVAFNGLVSEQPNTTGNPYFDPKIISGGLQPGEVEEGKFQVEIRSSAEYAVVSEFPFNFYFRDFDTNDWIGQATALSFETIDGPSLSDGDRFQLSDGWRTLTFEFDANDAVGSSTGVLPGNIRVGFSPNDSAAQIAVAVRDAINSNSVQQSFGVSASSPGGETAGAVLADWIILQGDASSDLNGGSNYTLTKADGTIVPVTSVNYGGVDTIGTDSGDSNRFRDQGQVLLQGNRISFSESFGIFADAGSRSTALAPLAGSEAPHPGSPQAFTTTNPDNLAPGVVIVNNVLFSNEDGGIRISGDSGTDTVQPFARLVNNTIYGTRNGDSGIRIDERAAPTLLNNAVTNSRYGIEVVGTTGPIEQFATLYWNNTTNTTGIGQGAVPISVPSSEAVFFDPSTGNFYPGEGSRLIDSSNGSTDERSSIRALKTALGISFSPILAPAVDITGQRRIDDATVNNTSGTGENLFVDRGAQDRSDFDGPIATLQQPLDNDAEGRDQDSSETFVRLIEGTLNQFIIQLDESSGTGPDPATVISESLIVTEDGRRLVAGVDYTFGYSTTSRKIVLTSSAGIWQPNSVYEITLNNRDRLVLQTQDGASIADGDQITITDSNGASVLFEFDSGYVLQLDSSLVMDVTTDIASFTDGSTFSITAPDGTVGTFEFNRFGNVSGSNVEVDLQSAVSAEDIRDAIFDAINEPTVSASLNLVPVKVGESQIQLGTVEGHVVTENQTGIELSGTARGVSDGDRFAYTTDIGTITFEFKETGYDVADLDAETDQVIEFSRSDSASEIGQAIVDAVRAQDLSLATARVIEGERVYLGGRPIDQLDLLQGSSLSITGTPGLTSGLTLTVPAAADGAIADGHRFSVTVNGNTTFFQVSTDPLRNSSDRLVFVTSSASATAIATKIAEAIDSEYSELNSTATDNVILLGEPNAEITPLTSVSVDVLASGLVKSGINGGAISIAYIPTVGYTPDAIAGQVMGAIARSGLISTSFAPGGGTVWLTDTTAVDYFTNETIGAIKDFAGNDLKPNRANGETQFTILMPGAKLDFGDAPSAYPTLTGNNGARHTLSNDRLPRLGSEVDADLDGLPINQDDQIDTVSVLAASPASFTTSAVNTSHLDVTVTSTPVEGDTLQIEVAGSILLTFELVRAGNSAAFGNIPVLTIPGESANSLADRMSAIVETELQKAADTAGITLHTDVRRDTTELGRFTVVSVDDEDGIRISDNFQTPNSPSTVDGIFVDRDGNFLGFLNPLDPQGTDISLSVQGTGLLDAWVDFNGDGDWDDPGEQILQNVAVLDGDNRVHVQVPAAAAEGLRWARFRLSTTGNQAPEGVAIGGEVEDYQVRVERITPPTAVDDQFSLDEDGSITVAADGVLANDILTSDLVFVVAELIEEAEFGTVSLNDDGSFIYDAAEGFYGTDTFTYRISGEQPIGAAGSPHVIVRSGQIATVTITVNPVNDVPVVADTNHSVLEDAPAGLTITAAQLFAGDPLDPADDAVPGAFSVSVVSPYNEEDQQLIITGINNDAAILDADAAPPTLLADGEHTFTSLQGQTITARFSGGALVDLTYFPSGDYNTDNPQGGLAELFDSFTFTVYDDGAVRDIDGLFRDPALRPEYAIATATISVTPVNDQPFIPTSGADAVEQEITVLEDSPIYDLPWTVVKPGPDSAVDEAGQTVAYALTSVSGDATATFTQLPTIDSNGRLHFELAPNRNGTMVFDVVPEDNGNTDAAIGDDAVGDPVRLTISITAVNDAPEFSVAFPTFSVLEQDDDSIAVNHQWATDVRPGPLTAVDEQSPAQSVQFTLVPDATNPVGLFAVAPTIAPDGTLNFTPAENAVGTALFVVTAADGANSDPAIPANPPTPGDEDTSTPVTLTIHVRPVNDKPLIDTEVAGTSDPTPETDDNWSVSSTGEITYTLREDNVDAGAAPGQYAINAIGMGGRIGLLDVFNAGPYLNAALDTNEEITDPAGDLGGGQGLQVLAVDTTLPAVPSPTLFPVMTTLGGRIDAEFDPVTGFITRLLYTPPTDQNSITDANPDSFTYTVGDNGQTWDLPPVPGAIGGLLPDPQIQTNTVYLVLNPINDAPIFTVPGSTTDVNGDIQSTVELLERDDESQPYSIVWADPVQVGPTTATDETADQTLQFELVEQSVSPSALFETAPVINPDGTLVFTPRMDAVGSAVYVVTAVDTGDTDATNPANRNVSVPVTLTIQVRPVNDNPVIDSSVAGTSDLTPEVDDNWSVSNTGEITFTLREDNVDSTATPASYVLDAVGSARIGLLDVFNAGPYFNGTDLNEEDGTLGGNQQLEILSFDGTTTLGGTVSAIMSGGVIVQLLYTPPTDLNSVTDPTADSFTYTVTDDGRTWELAPGADDLTADPLTATNTVHFILNPINDAPIFTVPGSTTDVNGDIQSTVELLERDDESQPYSIVWADPVLVGPTTATDEIADQTLQFELVEQSVSPSALFETAPVINPDGTLVFTPRMDAVGSAVYVVTAIDSGDTDATNPANRNVSVPVTLTIQVRPVNDNPVIDSSVAPSNGANFDLDDQWEVTDTGEIIFTLREDNASPITALPGQYVIDANGSFARIGLLDVFNAGPYFNGTDLNEEDTNTLGGSQTLEIVDFDGTTTLGGTVSAIMVGGEITQLLYTPPTNLNSVTNPTADSFTYTVSDNGETWELAPGADGLVGDPLEATNTVHFILNPINDAPQFTANPSVADVNGNIQSTIEVLERDDNSPYLIQWASGYQTGPSSALDELAAQGRSFNVVQMASSPNDLLVGDVEVSDTGILQFTPGVDQVGEAVFVITLVDEGNSVPPNAADRDTSIPVTLTIQIRPVNDAPRIDASLTNSNINLGPDEQSSVDGLGQITYVLPEDNSQAVPNAATPYVLNAEGTTGGLIGLLDVFNAGPDNEEDATTLGGNQKLRISSFDLQTRLGGQIDAETDVNGNIIRLLYTPPENTNSDFSTPDSFTYRVLDDGQTWQLGSGLSDDNQGEENTVFFVLNPVNDAPVFDAAFDSYTVIEDRVTVEVADYARSILAGPFSALDEIDVVNGQDIEFVVTAVDQAKATLLFGSTPPQVTDDGTLIFTPAADQYGTTVFEVTLRDFGPTDPSRGDEWVSEPVLLTITIQPQNDAPQFANSLPVQFELNEDGSIDIPYEALPGEPQGLLDKFTVGPTNEGSSEAGPGGGQTLRLAEPIPASTPAGGTLTQITDSQTGRKFLRYRPQAFFNGTDSFVYSVADNGFSVSETGITTSDSKRNFFTVDLIVNAVNNSPEFSGAGDVSVVEDAGETDPNVPADQIGLSVIPSWATNIQPGPAGADDEIENESVTFVITPVDSQVAEAIFAKDDQGNLLVSADPDGTLRFQTLPNISGTALFTVYAQDDSQVPGNNRSESKQFRITVQAVNDPPTFIPGDSEITVSEDSGPYAESWATDISAGPEAEDVTPPNVRFEASIAAADMALFQSQPEIEDDGTLRFTPAANANGIVPVTIRAIDSESGTSEAVTLEIVITATPDAPVAGDDTFNVNEDDVQTLLASAIKANDNDADIASPDESLVISLKSGTTLSGATITLDANNNVVYDPSGSLLLQALAPGETTTDSFVYTLTDDNGTGLVSNEATVSLVVSGINDAPILRPDNPDVQSTGTTVIRPLDNDIDIDGSIDPTSLQITLQPAFGSIEAQPDGSLIYTPFAGFRGTDTIRYTVADNLGLRSGTGLITIASNTSPIAVNDRSGTFRGEAIDVDVTANDYDPDFVEGVDTDPNKFIDPESVVIVTAPRSGQAVVLGNGIVRYVPNAGFSGTDTFTYQVSDNLGRSSNVATVQLQVVSSRLQNPIDNVDVNDDGAVSPVDALQIINYLNRQRPTQLNTAGAWASDKAYNRGDVVLYQQQTWVANQDSPAGTEPTVGQQWFTASQPFYDVDGNQRVEPLDALRVINYLNQQSRTGRSGEAVPDIDRSDRAPTEVVYDVIYTTVPSPSKVVGAPALEFDNESGSDDDLLDLLARDSSEATVNSDEDVLDQLWRTFE
ncbi:Dockerin type I repeat protein [Roseimaritima multifibrata]|uniref:Dockerin type I repeat protein n=1 Tax=Roseimaritima multifibrata TaxID=1930274 RepID=A0A517MCB5_9BACT|nr:Ig-like domain-containing protein [Roseimaritima multifibrata]QDS92515.1 Dockerin type I repeat protein [Roseimaritima multifibrata]